VKRVKWWVWLLLIALVVAGAIGFERKSTSELPVYTTGAERMVAGEEIYRTTDLKPFTYPPFFAVPFVPWVWTPAVLHRGLWYVVNVATLGLILVVLHRAIGPALRAPPTAVWVVTGLIAARHVSAVFENQSHDLLVFALVVLACRGWAARRDAAAGGWIGLAAACKATPALAIVPMVAQWRPLALAAVAVVGAVATFAPDLLFPRADGGSWAVAWYETFVAGLSVGGTAEGGNAWFAHSYLNQSLSGTLTRLLVPFEGQSEFFVDALVLDLGTTGRKWVNLAAQVGIVGLVFFAAFRCRGRGPLLRPWGEFGLVLCGMVLLSPMSSKSHFCVLLLPALFCSLHYLQHGRDRILGGLLVGSFALGTLTVKGVVGREWGNVFLAYGSVTWTALLLLLATAHVLHHGRDAVAAESGVDP